MDHVTRLLERFRERARDVVDELVPLVYAELRGIAGSFMRPAPPPCVAAPGARWRGALIDRHDMNDEILPSLQDHHWPNTATGVGHDERGVQCAAPADLKVRLSSTSM
jgi:hypothetical protein